MSGCVDEPLRRQLRRRLSGRLWALCALCAALLATARPVTGQQLSGFLVDLDSNEPLKSGLMTLRGREGRPIATIFTDERGFWEFDPPGPGVYYLEAMRLDYQPWVAGPFELEADDDFESVFHLRRRPIELAPIEVTVAPVRQHLERNGFYERQRADFGYFLTPEDIERHEASRFTDLLLRVPGVRLVAMNAGSVGGRYVVLRGSNLSDGGVCRPRVFVDGLLYALGDSRPKRLVQNDETERVEELLQRVDQGLSLNDIGPPEDIAGVEIYRSATQVPVQFGGTSVETLCGVIVVWTRRAALRARG